MRIYFFFSSRRRHTRYWRDWSSDVCSSDLHQIAAEVISYNEFALPPIWIEHYPPETTDGASETFEMVVFSSYEVTERAPYLGATKLTIGEPTWKMLDRDTVEIDRKSVV